jgi:uncharacterized phage protein (TIGR01671 family)
MLEKKMRAWELSRKKMLSWLELAKTENNELPLDGMAGADCRDGEYSSLLYDVMVGQAHRFVLMQFIGRVDRNGCEIYEGDVLDVVCCGGRNMFRVTIEDVRSIPDELKGSKFDWCVVLGNIYEQPELLGAAA